MTRLDGLLLPREPGARGLRRDARLAVGKLEDATRATVQSWGPAGSATACDPAFGPIPLPDRPDQDFDFAAPVTFPGEL